MQKPTRVHRIGAAALLVCLIGCGGGGEPEATATSAPAPALELEAPAAAIPRAPRPTHGGTVVDLGAYFVEVLTHDASAVDVLTLGDDRPDPSGTYATVWLTGADGALHPVVLTWDPVSERYRGLLRGVLPIPGPIRVAMVTGSERRSGEASTLVVSGAASASGGPAGVSGGRRRRTVATTTPRPGLATSSPATPADRPARGGRESAAPDAPPTDTTPLAFEPPSVSADTLARPAFEPPEAARTLAPRPHPTPAPGPGSTTATPATPPPRATVRVLSGPRTPPAGRAAVRPEIRARRARPAAGSGEAPTETRPPETRPGTTGRDRASVRPR